MIRQLWMHDSLDGLRPDTSENWRTAGSLNVIAHLMLARSHVRAQGDATNCFVRLCPAGRDRETLHSLTPLGQKITSFVKLMSAETRPVKRRRKSHGQGYSVSCERAGVSGSLISESAELAVVA